MSEADQKAIDQLTERSRIRGETRIVPEGADIAAVTTEVAAAVVRNVLDYKREKDLTFKAIARDVGVKESMLSQVINGKYPADGRSLILDLDRWLESQRRIDVAPKPASFTWTSVAREIKAVADATVELATIGLVFGPESSGIGKTTALQAVASERPGCIYISVDKCNATITGLLYLIGRELRIGSEYNSWRFNRICDALAGTSRLLVVDQIHNLCGARGDRPLYLLSDLYDRTRAPQLWAGTSDVVSYLRREQAKGHEPLSQIRSRIGIARDLTHARGGGGGDGPLFGIDEIRSVFGQGRMRLSPDAAKYLLRLANVPDGGALRSCKNLVVLATALYQSRHDVLSEELLRAAHRLLVTDESYSLMQAAIEQPAIWQARIA